MRKLVGKALVDHMQSAHGYLTWHPPTPNSREYRAWKRDHENDYHGRWADQQDHDHQVCRRRGGDQLRESDSYYNQD